MTWGGVPQMSEILEPSKPLQQALPAPKLLELHSDRGTGWRFFRVFLQGGCMYLFMWVTKKKKCKNLKNMEATQGIRHSNRPASPIFEK